MVAKFYIKAEDFTKFKKGRAVVLLDKNSKDIIEIIIKNIGEIEVGENMVGWPMIQRVGKGKTP